METFRVYECGGMSSLDWDSQNAWRESAKEWLEHLECNYKVKVINPCSYFNFKTVNHRSEREVMNFDLNQVRSSNLILVNFNDPRSIGSAVELFVAYENHIPVIGYCKDKDTIIHPWLLEYVDRMCLDLKDSLKYIANFYLLA